MNVKLECCTPMYALHALYEKQLNETELVKCTQFLKVYNESRVLLIDLSRENLPVIKEVSISNQTADFEDDVVTGVDAGKVIN